MDCDDVSLPDTDLIESEWRRAQRLRRFAMLELVLDFDEDVPSSSQILHELDRQTEPIASLAARHLELDQRKLALLLAHLSPLSTPSQDAPLSSPVPNTEDSAQDDKRQLWSMAQHVGSMLKAPRTTPDFDQLRELDLGGNSLQDESLCYLSLYLRRAHCLQVLDLRGNEFGADPVAFGAFGRFVGRSAVLSLLLHGNPIQPMSLASLLDGFQQDGSCIQLLYLSGIQGNQGFRNEAERWDIDADNLAAARAVANLISADSKCRRLSRLDLAGNDFTVRGWRAIFAAWVGSVWTLRDSDTTATMEPDHLAALASAESMRDWDHLVPRCERRPNRRLDIFEIMMPSVDRFIDDDERQEDLPEAGSFAAFLRTAPSDRKNCILQYLRQQQGQGTAMPRDHAEGDSDDAMVEAIIAEAGGDVEAWRDEYRSAVEWDSGVHLLPWKTIRALHSGRIQPDASRVQRAARAVLEGARILGCRARRRRAKGDESEGDAYCSRFCDLPPELRLLVVRHLDKDGALSERQFLEVVSYAQDRTTIGYGRIDYDWTEILNLSPYTASSSSEYQEEEGVITLPCHRWSWSDCFKYRSRPVDWPMMWAPLDGYGKMASDKLAFLRSTFTDVPDPEAEPTR